MYLHRVDAVLVREGYEVTRYADDLVIQCKTEQEAHAALARLREELVGRGLTLHHDKTRVTHVRRRGGSDFLGYHFEQSWRRPKKQAHESAARRVPDAPRETPVTCHGATRDLSRYNP
ncbi:reverse transcriptase domain-containing protein [Sorangium sp. So ce1504]|uniref:reverse transcriptase domain-containing protein n=1 Tax=Sorangium sp. So ce1504 TaxID=3133337 RepID=UPI003F6471E5